MTTPQPHTKRRLRDILTARFRPIHLVIAIMMFALGFAFISQIKIQSADPLDGVHEDELVLLLDQLTQSEQQLRVERAELTEQLQRLQSAHSQEQAAREAAEKERREAQILGGTQPVRGPGLLVTIIEGEQDISAQKFVTLLGELRNAGAEAMELNGHRIVASSYIGREGDTLTISGQPVASPYLWRIIGNADTLQPALEIQRGAASQLRATGATIQIQRSDTVRIDSTVSPMSYQYAEVVD